MARLPRDVSGTELIGKLAVYGYAVTRRASSHVRLTRSTADGQHHVTVPTHRSLRVGTLNSILNDVAAHLGRSKDSVVTELFS